MKKTVLALVTLICLSTAVNAQTGSILLYGNIGFNTNSNGGVNDAINASGPGSKGSFYINPGVGYQFNKAWTAGVEGGYNYADNGTYITKDYSAGAFLRYSQHIAGVFSAYEQLGLGYQGASEATGTINGIETQKFTGFYAHIIPTIYADIKNGFGLNFSVGGLEYSSFKPTGGQTSSTFGLTFGKQPTIGLSKNFGGK
jgi:hypothetical protein